MEAKRDADEGWLGDEGFVAEAFVDGDLRACVGHISVEHDADDKECAAGVLGVCAGVQGEELVATRGGEISRKAAADPFV